MSLINHPANLHLKATKLRIRTLRLLLISVADFLFRCSVGSAFNHVPVPIVVVVQCTNLLSSSQPCFSNLHVALLLLLFCCYIARWQECSEHNSRSTPLFQQMFCDPGIAFVVRRGLRWGWGLLVVTRPFYMPKGMWSTEWVTDVCLTRTFLLIDGKFPKVPRKSKVQRKKKYEWMVFLLNFWWEFQCVPEWGLESVAIFILTAKVFSLVQSYIIMMCTQHERRGVLHGLCGFY